MSWPFDFNQTIILSTLLATLILAIGTVILAYETKQMRMAQTKPEVFITFQPQKDQIKVIDLIIGNSGQGTAFNIKFKLYPDFEYEKGEFISELSFIKKGIPFLAPDQKLKSALMWLENINAIPFEELAKPFDIMIEYEDITKITYNRVYPMDLTPLGSIKERRITER